MVKVSGARSCPMWVPMWARTWVWVRVWARVWMWGGCGMDRLCNVHLCNVGWIWDGEVVRDERCMIAGEAEDVFRRRVIRY